MRHIKTYEGLFDIFKKSPTKEFNLNKIDIKDFESYNNKDINELAKFVSTLRKDVIISFINKLMNIYGPSGSIGNKNIENFFHNSEIKDYYKMYGARLMADIDAEDFDQSGYRDLSLPYDLDEDEIDVFNKYNL
jgi:hypothetical protein